MGKITPVVCLLRTARQDKEITQIEVAKALRVVPKTVSRWERGERQLSDEYAIKWARFMGYRLGYYLEEYPRPEKRYHVVT